MVIAAPGNCGLLEELGHDPRTGDPHHPANLGIVMPEAIDAAFNVEEDSGETVDPSPALTEAEHDFNDYDNENHLTILGENSGREPNGEAATDPVLVHKVLPDSHERDVIDKVAVIECVIYVPADGRCCIGFGMETVTDKI